MPLAPKPSGIDQDLSDRVVLPTAPASLVGCTTSKRPRRYSEQAHGKCPIRLRDVGVISRLLTLSCLLSSGCTACKAQLDAISKQEAVN
jgi:hypothetical protein